MGFFEITKKTKIVLEGCMVDYTKPMDQLPLAELMIHVKQACTLAGI